MMPIYIIGYMGAGKSTFGKKLAFELEIPFIDTDIFLENRFRQRIIDMFASVGEETFRRRERMILEELSGMTDCIIATGGGLPCHHDNITLMLETGLVIYLEASDETLARRLEYCKRTRPSISHKSGEDLLRHVQTSMQERRDIYEQAHLTLSIETLTSADAERALATELAARLRQNELTYPQIPLQPCN